MQNRIMAIFKKRFSVFLIFILSFFVAWANFNTKTYLSGWDTLHPEFDFGLNLKRVIYGVWREEQGLGTVAAHAHMSELPRIIILWLLHFIMPISFLRYGYVFLCLFLGPVGVYFFLEKIIFKNQSEIIKKASSFLGAIFYLLNFGTVQNFYVPFEMFPTLFAFIGWIFLFSFQFLEQGSKKNLLLFSLFVILSTPMAYASQLWYSFFLSFIILIFGYGIFSSDFKLNFKKALILFFLLLSLNSFWLLPNLYYIKNHSSIPQNAKINRISSEEFFYHNQKFGTIKETALLRNFYYDWAKYNFQEGKFEYLMKNWKNHFQSQLIITLGYLFFLIVILGLLSSLFFLPKSFYFPFLFAFVINFFFIANQIPIISYFFNFLRTHSPLLKEALRFPFNKFSINLTFFYSTYFSLFFCLLFGLLGKKISQKKLTVFSLFTSFFIFYLLFLYIKPAFLGYLIDPLMKVNIPNKYFNLGKWLNNQSNKGRILKLPINTYAGWLYYNWGYQGAGFNWFNIKQPTLDRDFDRWYPYNEQSFREFFYAVYSKNASLFEKLLQKYHIAYILLDENVIIPGEGENSKKLFYPEIKELLAKIENIKLAQKFGKKISLFEYLPNKEKPPVEILTDYKTVEPSYRWNYIDEAYQKFSNYITTTLQIYSLKRPSLTLSKKPYDNLNLIIYPTRSILTEEEKINKEILSIGKESYQITFPKTTIFENGEIKIPSLLNTESEFFSEVYAKKISKETAIEIKYLLPYFASDEVYKKQFILKDKSQKIFSLNEKVFLIPENLSKNPTYLGEVALFTQKENRLSFYNQDKPETLPANFSFDLNPNLCSTPSQNQIFGGETISSGFKIYGQEAKICAEISLNNLVKIKEDGALQLTFDYQTQTDEENEFCFFDQIKNQCLLSKNLKPSFSSVINFFIPINQEKLNSYLLKFAFDTRKETQIKELVIKNFRFNFYKKIAEENFIPEIPPFELETKEFKLLGKFPRQKIEITPQTIGEEKKDCSFEKAKLIDKQFIETSDGTVLEYKAIDGLICDSLPLLNISQNIGHILAIESQNLSGLPLKICLEDEESSICHLEERLSKNKNLAYDYFIIPPYSQKGGYRLLINNYSIGNVASINRIKTVKLIPFPYLFFQAIRWESENQKKISINHQQNSKVIKHFPWLYSVTLEKNSPNNALLVLDQAYEKNWKAYFVPNFQFSIFNFQFLTKYFPFIFGQEIKDHFLVNNWANAWLIENKPKPADQSWHEPSTDSSEKASAKIRRGWQIKSQNSNLKSQNELIIIFFPQYLEFVGFGLLIFALIYIVFFYKIKRYEKIS